MPAAKVAANAAPPIITSPTFSERFIGPTRARGRLKQNRSKIRLEPRRQIALRQ
jgi:hypothetical protein